jgi:hypothetical protein
MQGAQKHGKGVTNNLVGLLEENKYGMQLL